MIELNGHPLSLAEIAAVAIKRDRVQISAAARPRIDKSRRVVEDIVARDAVVYGVTTGFGKLSEVHIAHNDLRDLQRISYAVILPGVGSPLSEAEVRAMMLLRANVLSLGFSGIRFEVVELLIEMLNRGVHPVVLEKGSVGASGDLAPLAHLALTLIGEGEAFYQGTRLPSRDALKQASLHPIQLEAKEGLALLNGTQAMHAVGGSRYSALNDWQASPMSPAP